MTSPTAEKLLTAEEFAETKDPPNMETELVRGRIVCMPPAKTPHGYYGARIGDALGDFFRPRKLGISTGEGGYVLARDPDTVRAPDAAFLKASRVPPGWPDLDEYVEGAPTLAVEVVSRGQTEDEVARKIEDWLDGGAERVWEVRPRLRTVTVHRRGAEPRTFTAEDTLTSDDAAFEVEGFALVVGDIFA